MKRKILLFIWLFLFFFAPLVKGAELSLTVLDGEEYFPVQKAQVKIINHSPQETNAWGQVNFDGVGKGPILISVYHPQYQQYKKVYFVLKEWQEIIIYLERDYQNISEDNPIVVNATDEDYQKLNFLLKDVSLFNSISLLGDPNSILNLIAYEGKCEFLKKWLSLEVKESPVSKSSFEEVKPLALIDELNGSNKGVYSRSSDDIEYILGQEQVAMKEPNLKLMIQPPRTKKYKPHRKTRILTVVTVDSSGMPLGSQKVEVYNYSDNRLISAQWTDTFGRAIFYELPKAKVKIKVGKLSKVVYLKGIYNFADFEIKTKNEKKQKVAFEDKIKELIRKGGKEKEKNKWEMVKKEEKSSLESEDGKKEKSQPKIIKINNMKFRW